MATRPPLPAQSPKHDSVDFEAASPDTDPKIAFYPGGALGRLTPMQRLSADVNNVRGQRI